MTGDATARNLHLVPDEPDLDRPLANVGAEQALLGWVMWSGKIADDVVDLVSAEDFYKPAHAAIWSAILNVHDRGEPIDVHVVRHVLAQRKQVAFVGGTNALHDLARDAPSGTPFWHAKRVAGIARVRRLRETLVRCVAKLSDPDCDPDTVIGEVEAAVLAADTTREDQAESSYGDFGGPVFDSYVANEQANAGLPTGLKDLDKLIGGMKPGQLIIVAGRPGMGKSLSALGFLTATADTGRNALLFSLEMSRKEVLARSMAAAAKVPLNMILDGRLGPEEIERLKAKRNDILGLPIHVDPSTSATLAHIRATARRMKQRGDLAVIGVDYLQLVNTVARKDGNRVQELGELSRGLKLLAGELEVPIVACAQLNRGSEGRADKRPQLADLRESGALENDADIVIMVHREDYYDHESPRSGEADFMVLKNRNGATDTLAFSAQLHFACFKDMAV